MERYAVTLTSHGPAAAAVSGATGYCPSYCTSTLTLVTAALHTRATYTDPTIPFEKVRMPFGVRPVVSFEYAAQSHLQRKRGNRECERSKMMSGAGGL